MGLIKRMRKQVAVYWARGSVDGYGQVSYGTGVEIACRWEEKITNIRDQKGEERVSRATVYVDRVVDVGGFLLLGALDSTVDSDDPRANSEAWEILSFTKLPNLKATEFLLTAYL